MPWLFMYETEHGLGEAPEMDTPLALLLKDVV